MSKKVLRLPENTKGRDFIVADVHGCYELLDQALEAVHFDPDKDRLIAIGDLVNRGPQSAECLYYLAQPWFFALRGNHEDMLSALVGDAGEIDVSRFKSGVPPFVKWTLAETPDTLLDMKEALEKLPYAIEIETARGKIGLVHADVPEGMNWDTFTKKLENDDPDMMVRRIAAWGRWRIDNESEAGVEGVERVFFGHSPQERPKKLGNCFFVDTGAVFRMNGESEQDFALTIVDLAASDEAILNPAKTDITLVRIAAPDKSPPKPDCKMKPPAP